MDTHNLIVGGDGTIGKALHNAFQRMHIRHYITSRHKESCNQQCIFLDFEKDVSLFQPPVPGGIAFLCAGISSLQECENAPVYTQYINVSQILALAQNLLKSGYRIVFFSTSQVFDGEHVLPGPESPPNPRTEYGRQKVVVEKALLGMHDANLVLRLPKVIGSNFSLFVRWRHALLHQQTVQAFNDLQVAPVTLEQLVHVVMKLAFHGKRGVWHISPHEELTYLQLAMTLAEMWGYDASLVHGISALECFPPAFCPQHVTLESSLTWTSCALDVPKPVDALQQYS